MHTHDRGHSPAAGRICGVTRTPRSARCAGALARTGPVARARTVGHTVVTHRGTVHSAHRARTHRSARGTVRGAVDNREWNGIHTAAAPERLRGPRLLGAGLARRPAAQRDRAHAPLPINFICQIDSSVAFSAGRVYHGTVGMRKTQPDAFARRRPSGRGRSPAGRAWSWPAAASGPWPPAGDGGGGGGFIVLPLGENPIA
jgi:hypothetical protein